MNKSEYTKGLLGVDIGMDEKPFGYSILITAGGEAIGSIYGNTPENCEANANRLVKCGNMHNIAMDLLLEFIRESKSDTKTVKAAARLLNLDKETI